MFLNKIISILDRILTFMTPVSYWIVFICIIGMTFLVVTDALMRALLNSGIKGSTEMSTYLLVIIGFLGIVLANAGGRHIAISFLLDRLSGNIKKFIGLINYFILISLSILFFYSGTQKAISAFYVRESEWFGAYIFPVWAFRFVVPIAFFFLICQFLTEVFQSNKNNHTYEKK